MSHGPPAREQTLTFAGGTEFVADASFTLPERWRTAFWPTRSSPSATAVAPKAT